MRWPRKIFALAALGIGLVGVLALVVILGAESAIDFDRWWGAWKANSEAARNLAFTLAGALAGYGLWLAHKRTNAAHLQAQVAESRLDTESQLGKARLDTERFSKATEQWATKRWRCDSARSTSWSKSPGTVQRNITGQ